MTCHIAAKLPPPPTAPAARVVWFDVAGRPAPQGSKKPVPDGRGGVRLIEVNADRKRLWRDTVVLAASRRRPKTPLDGPLEVRITFRFPMPASRRAQVRRAGVAWMAVSPDIDKLTRNLHDALTDARVIRDDARIVLATQAQIEVAPPAKPGASVLVRELTADDLARLVALGPAAVPGPATLIAGAGR